ncbi:glycoside hydrolase family 43 protein, partial [Duncaniella freteri]
MCSCNQQGAGNETGDDLYMFTSFHEPADEGLRFLYSEDGIHWDSIAGTWLAPTLGDSIMRDPSIVVGPDSTFHLVWTIAWKGDTGFGYSSSRDLVNWSEQRRIPAMDSVASTQNLWAPELFYDDVKGQYMVVYASCVPDAGFDVGIEEEKNNHRLYYVTTKDFTTFSDPKLFYEPGFSCIDATLVKRGPEDYVMVVKDNTRPNRNIKVAFAKDAEGPYTAASEPFTESFTEGPSVAKVGDEYYIYYDTYRKFIYSAHKTSDFKTFTDVTDSISVPS